jgi:pimeloyl-ACP methyl ester carboxylesterase
MDSGDAAIGRLMAWRSEAVRRLVKWKRIALSRLSLHYPPLVRFLPTPRPLQIRRCPYVGSPGERDLLVCLPGIGDEAQDFEDWGFVDLVRAHEWPVDVLLVDAHYGYYANRTVLDQLHRDVFLPATGAGYRSIWLAGISLGGFGALLYASRYECDLTGVVAMAPFLGTQTVVREIALAGGLARWTSTMTTSDEIQEMWKWLQTRMHNARPTPDIFLAYGEEDIFADAHRLLASSLPGTHVLTAPGGHRWPVWRQLWKEFLGRHQTLDLTRR